MEAQELLVVGRVADDGDGGRVDDIDEAAQKLRRADAAGEDGDHAEGSAALPGTGRPSGA